MTIITLGKLHYKCVKATNFSEFKILCPGKRHRNNKFMNYKCVKNSEFYVIDKHGNNEFVNYKLCKKL
jgi:hypothetical protein